MTLFSNLFSAYRFIKRSLTLHNKHHQQYIIISGQIYIIGKGIATSSSLKALVAFLLDYLSSLLFSLGVIPPRRETSLSHS